MTKLIAEYFISEISINPLLRNQVVAHPINYPQESTFFAYRVSLFSMRSINNKQYIKICEYFRIYIFLVVSLNRKVMGFWSG